jgi:hypothetical protein
MTTNGSDQSLRAERAIASVMEAFDDIDMQAQLGLDKRVPPPAITVASPRSCEGEATVMAGGVAEVCEN